MLPDHLERDDRLASERMTVIAVTPRPIAPGGIVSGTKASSGVVGQRSLSPPPTHPAEPPISAGPSARTFFDQVQDCSPVPELLRARDADVSEADQNGCGKSQGGVMNPPLAVLAAAASPSRPPGVRSRSRARGVCAFGAFLAIVGVVSVGCGATRTVTRTVTVPGTAKSEVGPPGEQVEFGYIKSLKRTGGRFEMRFDPAWFLSGLTASRAKFEDTGSADVPNDNYVVNEGHRLLTYVVSATAQVTALTKGVAGSPITVSQLAQLVNGKNPFNRPLFEPITTGFWILINIDTVRSLDQQYVP
jgi:hypothetical protein